MSAHVFLNLLNELEENDKMRGLSSLCMYGTKMGPAS